VSRSASSPYRISPRLSVARLTLSQWIIYQEIIQNVLCPDQVMENHALDDAQWISSHTIMLDVGYPKSTSISGFVEIRQPSFSIFRSVSLSNIQSDSCFVAMKKHSMYIHFSRVFDNEYRSSRRGVRLHFLCTLALIPGLKHFPSFNFAFASWLCASVSAILSFPHVLARRLRILYRHSND
jgi:hypothetical protein